MKIIFFIFAWCCMVLPAEAQDYYKDVSTITVDDMIFSVKRSYNTVALSNIENKYGNAPYVYKDGRPFNMEDEIFLDMGAADPMCVSRAYTETFTKEEYLELKAIGRCPLVVGFVVDSEGNTIEVSFSIIAIPEMLSIPPSKFALLEKNMKKYIKWSLNPLAKQLQFIGGMSFANFSNGGLYYPGDTIPPLDDNQLEIDDGSTRPPGFYTD